jgi:hypothetical protein
MLLIGGVLFVGGFLLSLVLVAWTNEKIWHTTRDFWVFTCLGIGAGLTLAGAILIDPSTLAGTAQPFPILGITNPYIFILLGLVASSLSAIVASALESNQHTIAYLRKIGVLPRPRQVDLDIAAFNIKHLERTSNNRTIENHALELVREHQLYMGTKLEETTLFLPEGSYAQSVLKLPNGVIAKILSPNYDRGDLHWRVVVLGCDKTNQPFLAELPPNYKKKSLEECERWIMNADKDDTIKVEE